MTKLFAQIENAIRNSWRVNAPLTGVGLLMLLALAASAIGLLVDPRIITGVPAWLKPAKFAVSIAIYCFTLTWVFSYLPEWVKTRRIVGILTAAVFMIEIAIIDFQAWRGTTSHFNVSTPFDAVLFGIMGTAIVVQTLASIAVAVAVWRERFANAAFGWAVRLGLSISIVGAMTGGVMTTPTKAQLAEARTTHHLERSGAHTVGGPDGGPGLPGTGWSVQHGDIRVAHFFGLHALQVLPLILVAVRRRVARIRQTPFIVAAAFSYLGLFAILLVQALRGQPLTAPDSFTIATIALWAIATLTTLWAIAGRHADMNPSAARLAAW